MLRGTCLVLLLAAPRLGAQVELSAGLGAGSIRYAGGTSVASATLSPAVSISRAWGTGGAAAAFGPISGGTWAGQLRTDAWVSWFGDRAVRPAAALVVDGSVQTGGPATGAVHLLAEALWVRGGRGVAIGIGPSLGAIVATEPVSALRARARGWGRIGTATATALLEPQRLDGVWFTDMTFGVATPPGRIAASAWLAARVSEAYDSRIAGSVSAVYTAAPWLAVEAAGGSYLPDLYQGFPASGFVTLGVRVFAGRRPPAARPDEGLRPAVAVRDGDSVTVRFRVPGVSAVAIAGEWTDWNPVPLQPTGGDGWSVRVLAPPGVYRFNLVLDSGRWIVPAGIATVDDGLGGVAGLLVVP